MSRSKLLKRSIELDQLLRMVGLRKRTTLLGRALAGVGFGLVAMAVGLGAGLVLGPSYGRRLKQGFDARVIRMRARGEHPQQEHVSTDSSPQT